jgi:deoxycytidylate deaminase
MRPSKDEMWLSICKELAKQTTCVRKGVGCVLLDANGHVLSTGYNGVAAGLPHCNEKEKFDIAIKCDTCSSQIGKGSCNASACPGWNPKKSLVPTDAKREVGNWVSYHPHACEGAKYDSGEGLGKCQAIHAEQNALLQCPDIMKIHTCYTTSSPCNEQCIKLLLNTSCQRIVFLEEYSKSGKDAWLAAGREWVQHDEC